MAAYSHKNLRTAIELVKRVWDCVSWIGRASWACRVGLLSGVAGLLLFSLAVQAQNLFSDLSFSHFFGGVPYWLTVFLLVFLVWAFPIHYSSRRSLDDDAWLVPHRLRVRMSPEMVRSLTELLRTRHRVLINCLPRIIAMMPFLAIILGLRGAFQAVAGADDLLEAKETKTQIWFLFALDMVVLGLFLLFVVNRRPLLKWLMKSFQGPGRGPTRIGWAKRALGGIYGLSVWTTVFVFLVAYVRPETIADHAPRAMLAPLLLGSLVLSLGAVALWGDRHGVPALAIVIAFFAVATGLNASFNDVRLIPASNDERIERRQIEIEEAVKNWRVANGCEASICPPALIVAAAGGGSRAAFMTATVIGHLMDREREFGDNAELTTPGRRIFAISGVSGGAFGAAVVRAAIEDSLAQSKATPPCVNLQRNWFGNPVGHLDYKTSWRSCLQLLVSGDFLSPGFVGLGFRDNFAMPYVISYDRAVLLERAWERHYNYVARDRQSISEQGGDCGEHAEQWLCRPFGYARDLPPRAWAPLLLLNGTSVNTGRRIIVSDLVSTRSDGDNSRIPLYSAALDYFEMTSTGCLAPDHLACPAAKEGANDVPKLRDGPDIRLSTAALLSARFPIVSPAGLIRAKGRPGFGDSVVDGGYFENAGTHHRPRRGDGLEGQRDYAAHSLDPK